MSTENKKMPEPVEVDFADVEQKSIADLLAKADAGDVDAAEILRKMRAEVVKATPEVMPTESSVMGVDQAKADEIMVAVPEEKPGEAPQGFLKRLEVAIAESMGIPPGLMGLTPPMQTGGLPVQPELPAQPIALQVEKVAETADIPVQAPRPPVKDPLVIRIQRRRAKDGTELFRVHRQCDRFWHWAPTYAQASTIATSLFHYGCIYEDCNAAAAS